MVVGHKTGQRLKSVVPQVQVISSLHWSKSHSRHSNQPIFPDANTAIVKSYKFESRLIVQRPRYVHQEYSCLMFIVLS